MNPIFTWIIAHTVGKSLARQCLNCRREQVIPKSKINESVPCQRCGKPIPPPKRT